MESNVIHYGDLLNQIFVRLIQGSKSDKDVKWYKILQQWQNKEYGKYDIN